MDERSEDQSISSDLMRDILQRRSLVVMRRGDGRTLWRSTNFQQLNGRRFRAGNRVKENTGRNWVFTFKAKSTRLPLLVMASYIRAVFEHKDPSKTVQSHGQ
ncbi:hypothetical protein KSP39_PZI000560 [Platanthera zijinensis]|uniref:Uncharacterized protein n=1 Tax=Platanthera zijinensis TaxID=2320716 RepID=A0AAP0C109_9ASPA